MTAKRRINVQVSMQAFKRLEAEQDRRERETGAIVSKGEIFEELLLSLMDAYLPSDKAKHDSDNRIARKIEREIRQT